MRRKWAPVVAMSTSELAGVRAVPDGPGGPGGRNERYVAARELSDRNHTSARFVANATIEDWRRWMRDDATARNVLLNPSEYEPRGDS